MKICLISCSKSKQNFACKAKEMYSKSLRFRLSYKFAKYVLKADKIFILSAKYGVLEQDEVICPYDKTLNKMSRSEQKGWAEQVVKTLSNKCDLVADDFTILAGKNYYKDLVTVLHNYSLPLENKALGEGNSYLKKMLIDYGVKEDG